MLLFWRATTSKRRTRFRSSRAETRCDSREVGSVEAGTGLPEPESEGEPVMDCGFDFPAVAVMGLCDCWVVGGLGNTRGL